MPEVPATVAKNIIAEYCNRVASYIEAQGQAGLNRAQAHDRKCQELAAAIRDAGANQAADTAAFFTRIFEVEADLTATEDRFNGKAAAAIEEQITQLEENRP